MPPRKPTSFDRYFASRMEDPAFASEYESARREIDAVDALVRALDAARVARGLSKAGLAKRARIAPELVRRLFTSEGPNPTLSTVAKLATALDFELRLDPRTVARRPGKASGRKGQPATLRGTRRRSSSPSARTRA